MNDDSQKTNGNTSFYYFGFYDSGFSDYIVQMHIIYSLSGGKQQDRAKEQDRERQT